MTDIDSQEEEISAVKSIYIENDLLFYDSNLKKGVFYAKVSSENGFELNFGNLLKKKKKLKISNFLF
jgi:hypothetical protein